MDRAAAVFQRHQAWSHISFDRRGGTEIQNLGVLLEEIGGDADSSTLPGGRGEAHGSRAGGRPAPSVETFRADPLFPGIERALAAILEKGKVTG